MYCIVFTNCIFLCKNIASYLKEYKATCSFDTNISSFKEFSMRMVIAPFWQQYKMSITHCMLCRNLIFWKTNLIFWKTYWMIEGRLHLSIQGRKTTFLRKERCMFRGLLYILQGYSFLKKVMPFPEGKLQFMNERYILTWRFLPGQHYIWQMNAS